MINDIAENKSAGVVSCNSSIFLILISTFPSSEASHRSTDVSIQFIADSCCTVGASAFVRIADSEANLDSSVKDAVIFTVHSTSNPKPVKFIAEEVPLRNSGMFTGIIPISDISTTVGDTITASYYYQSHGQTFTVLINGEIRGSAETKPKSFIV